MWIYIAHYRKNLLKCYRLIGRKRERLQRLSVNVNRTRRITKVIEQQVQVVK